MTHRIDLRLHAAMVAVGMSLAWSSAQAIDTIPLTRDPGVSDVLISLTADARAKSVIEESPVVFQLTVRNVQQFQGDIQITEISPLEPLDFLGGDMRDQALNPSVVNATRCTDFPLAFGSTCSFQLLALTTDLDKEHSGTNTGLWGIDLLISARPVNPAATVIRNFGQLEVEVRDPGAVSMIPEPSTSLLMMCGIAGLLAAGRARSLGRRVLPRES